MGPFWGVASVNVATTTIQVVSQEHTYKTPSFWDNEVAFLYTGLAGRSLRSSSLRDTSCIGPPPPPSRAPSFCLATVSLAPSARLTAFVTDSGRPQPPRQPPPTTCLTASGVPSLLMDPRRKGFAADGFPLLLPQGFANPRHSTTASGIHISPGTSTPKKYIINAPSWWPRHTTRPDSSIKRVLFSGCGLRS